MDLILFLAAGMFICEDAAMGRFGSLVGGVLGGRAGLVAMIFNELVENLKNKMGELTDQLSNGPDSFFGSRDVYL